MLSKFTYKEITALKVFAILGVIFGIWFNVFLFIEPFTGLRSDSNTSIIPIIKISTIVFQTIFTLIVTIGFVWVYMSMKVNRWLSLIVGGLGGIIAGGITFGLTIAVLASIAIPAGVIEDNGNSLFAVLNTMPWWRIFGYIFVRGFALGGYFGAIPGAVSGLVLSWSLGYGTKKETYK